MAGLGASIAAAAAEANTRTRKYLRRVAEALNEAALILVRCLPGPPERESERFVHVSAAAFCWKGTLAGFVAHLDDRPSSDTKRCTEEGFRTVVRHNRARSVIAIPTVIPTRPKKGAYC